MNWSVVAELAGLALLVLGATAVVVAAFAVDWRAGTATTGAALITAGWFLTTGKEQ